MPWVDPRNYASFDTKVRHAQAAERGKLHFLFLPDGPSHVSDRSGRLQGSFQGMIPRTL
jgi:alkanesulfonate monooxygenase SsuD/methylene tetrahydromethanopterin reductase-like flavin-dependent oxidoreductase (luciferase family)